jgi:hypothetical protein
LINSGFARLEYAKHFSAFLFETEPTQNAKTVYIERRDGTDGNQRSAIAVVG